MSTDFTPTPIFYAIVSFIIGLIVGWVSGFFDSNSRSAKKIKAAESNAEIAVQDAEKKIAQANQKLAQQVVPQQIITQDDPGLLRLKNNSGYFALELDGTSVNSALLPDKKKRLIELLTVIRPYLEGSLPPQAPAPVAAPQPTPTMPAPVAQPISSTPIYVATPAAESADPPKTIINPDDKKTMASLSMVGQIDAILQARLINTTLEKRGIRVNESPEGGVQVDVGLEKFAAIDDITDPEVKAFIRAAVAEWEKKFTPGL